MFGYALFVSSLVHLEDVFSVNVETQTLSRLYLAQNLQVLEKLQNHSNLMDRLVSYVEYLSDLLIISVLYST